MADTAEIELRDTVLALVGHFDKQHLEEYAALFSEDTDWENAFGWRLRGRRRLKEFLGQFLWPIQAGSKFGPISYRAEFLFPDVALVEYSFERIPPANGPLAKRLVRFTHILRKQNGEWQVILTRIWDPMTPPLSPPVDRFPEFKDAPFSSMQTL